MKSGEYWAARMEALNEALLSRGEAYIQQMNAEYGRAMASIQKDIDAFYQRFAVNNSVDLASARQMLAAGELREFKWTVEDYIKAGKENAIDQRWMKELENASIRVRVSRLEALQLQMRQHVETLTAKRQTGTAETMGRIYNDGYYRSVFELQRGAGVGASFARLDARHIDELLVTPWAPDGSNFSARIWTDRTKLVSELQTALTQGLIRGDTSQEMIAQLQERMGVSRSAAARLVMTESAYFAGQSRLDGYREFAVASYKYTATLDTRTSTVCRDMDGEVFRVADAEPGVNYPPLHAHCRSTTIPYYGEDSVPPRRTARGDDGKTYDVPGDLTYEEWAKQQKIPGPPEMPPPAPPKSPLPPAGATVVPPPSAQDLMNSSAAEISDIYQKHKDAEPLITTTVSEVVRESGGKMAGLEFRLKDKDSFVRKVAADLEADLKINATLRPLDVAQSVNDVIRYTAVAGPESLYGVYTAAIMGLINEGHAVRKVKNTWRDGNNPYNGVNVIMVSQAGIAYELQFHTPESFEMKQETLHKLYEEYRLPSTPKARKMELWKEMLRLADGLSKPDGIDKIK